MRSRRHLVSDHEGIWEIWPAFTDVMSTLALILFVLVLLSYVRSLVSAKQLDAFQRQIAASGRQLQTLRSQIDAERGELASAKSKVEQQAGGNAALAAAEHRRAARGRAEQAEAGHRSAAAAAGRRIEIAVIPRDDNVRSVIDQYVRSAAQMPPPATP